MFNARRIAECQTIEELRAECARLQNLQQKCYSYGFRWPIAENIAAQVPALLDRIAELERDAARYKTERDFLVEEYERAVKCGPQGYPHAAMHLFNAIVNARIDAAMQAQTKEEWNQYPMPIIHAKFETTSDGLIGSTGAPIARIDQNDDGSYTVVIDHWPDRPRIHPSS